MNSQLREELTNLLADHLTMAEGSRILNGYKPATAWDRWRHVAHDAMEFIYGDEASETGQDPNHWSSHTGHTDSGPCCRGLAGCDCVGCGNCDGAVDPQVSLTGVVHPPTSLQAELRSQFQPLPWDVLQSATEAFDPGPVSDSGSSAPSAPQQPATDD
jgi:hypothetical protein